MAQWAVAQNVKVLEESRCNKRKDKKSNKKECAPIDLCLDPFEVCTEEYWIQPPNICHTPKCQEVQGKPFTVVAKFKVTPPKVICHPDKCDICVPKVKVPSRRITVTPPELVLNAKYEQKNLRCCGKEHEHEHEHEHKLKQEEQLSAKSKSANWSDSYSRY